MVINKGKKVIPPSDELALGLILDQLHVLVRPDFLDAINEVLKDSLASSLSKDVIDCFIPPDEVGTPEIIQSEIIELDSDPEFRE